MGAGREAAKRYVQRAAIILFCVWSLAMIGYSIVELRSHGRDQERFAGMMERLRSEADPDRLVGLRDEPTDDALEGHETQSWVDAYVHPGTTSQAIVNLGAMWFFPAFFFLCVFLFARLKTT